MLIVPLFSQFLYCKVYYGDYGDQKKKTEFFYDLIGKISTAWSSVLSKEIALVYHKLLFHSSLHYLKMIYKCLHGAFLFPIIKGALHDPFNWIRFLEINKSCNLMAENLTFSTNRKLFSISWKWKWMNRIRHRRENVVRKQKFDLIWKIIYLYKSMSGKNPPEKKPPVRGQR